MLFNLKDLSILGSWYPRGILRPIPCGSWGTTLSLFDQWLWWHLGSICRMLVRTACALVGRALVHFLRVEEKKEESKRPFYRVHRAEEEDVKSWAVFVKGREQKVPMRENYSWIALSKTLCTINSSRTGMAMLSLLSSQHMQTRPWNGTNFQWMPVEWWIDEWMDPHEDTKQSQMDVCWHFSEWISECTTHIWLLYN